jgi:hypothetical protein
MHKQAAAFLKKSGAKNFFDTGSGAGQRQCQRHRTSIKKFFCFFLFTKRSAS